MPNPYLLYGAGAGLNLSSRILDVRSERERQKRNQQRMLAALAPLEAEAQLYSMAPTQAEGYAMGEATDRAQSSLASRGLSESSFVGPEVAKAIAPYLLQRESNIHERFADLAAAKIGIFQQTQAPGYGTAAAGLLGDAGGLLAQIGGQQEGEDRLLSLIERLRAMGQTPTGLVGGQPAIGSPGFVGPQAPMQAGYGGGGGVPAGPSADDDLLGLIMGFREGAASLGFLR